MLDERIKGTNQVFIVNFVAKNVLSLCVIRKQDSRI
jgi:hypothetical protein